MTYGTEQRLKSYLDTNQLVREQMCRAILALDRRFSEVTQRHPRGGRDGGRDIQANFNDNQLAYAAVGFVNQANDSKEQKKQITEKFKDDLKSAISGEIKPSVFVFMTNINLTVGEKTKLESLAKKSQISTCEIFDRDRLQISLDNPDGFSVRFQCLGIPLSEPEQASFFAKWGTDINSLVSNGFQDVNRKLDRMIFLQESNEILESLVVSLQLDKKYSAEEVGHFRAFCSIFFKAPFNDVLRIVFSSSDKSRRFSEDSINKINTDLTGIRHGISSATWETLLQLSSRREQDEKNRLVSRTSRLGVNEVEFIPIKLEYYDFIRVEPRPTVKAFDEANYLPFLNMSLAEKVVAIRVYANGYKLNEFNKEDFFVDKSDISLEELTQFSSDELSDKWVRIRPSSLNSSFQISFSRNTPKRLFDSPFPPDSPPIIRK